MRTFIRGQWAERRETIEVRNPGDGLRPARHAGDGAVLYGD